MVNRKYGDKWHDNKIKIFLASPSDVSSYRKATIKVVDELNKLCLAKDNTSPFDIYSWEVSKKTGFTENYQEDIFKEVGHHIDVFILILWHQIGSGGTETEYDRMKSHFINIIQK